MTDYPILSKTCKCGNVMSIRREGSTYAATVDGCRWSGNSMYARSISTKTAVCTDCGSYHRVSTFKPDGTTLPKTKRETVVIELGYGNQRHIERVIHDAAPTGHTAKTWAGSKRYQWQGTIHYEGKSLSVYGYADSPYPSRPLEWSNDSY